MPLVFRQAGLSLLALRRVARLGRIFLRGPPGLVVAVPVDSCGEAGGEVGVAGLPAQFVAQLGRVDRVAQVVPGSVGDVVVGVGGLAELREDQLTTSLLFFSPSAPMRYVSPVTPFSRMVSTAEEWSSA